MRCSWAKIIVLLVVAVAVLQVLHMLLLSRLELRNSNARWAEEGRPGSGLGLQEAWLRDLAGMEAALRASSVLDASGEFKVVNFLAHAEARGSRKDVTLVTQCSHNHATRLAALGRRWDGPLSIAMFATRESLADAIRVLASLRQCLPGMRRNASFHLVFPLGQQPGPSLLSSTSRCDCSALFASTAIHTNYGYEDTVYPNNLLRNVARRNVQTEFVLVIDADMMPSSGLHSDFLQFAHENRLFRETKRDDKTVYVVPAFEAGEDTQPPRDKNGLLLLIEQNRARPFYFELCWKCQKHTDYDAWQREPQAPHLGVLFEVLWKDPWEPFYIGRNTVPFYDERFKQYGFNRISQVCELHISGYKFSVLNNAFLLHHGLKTSTSFHRQKGQDQERNRLLFRQFKTELKDKYPDASRRCY